MRRRGGIWAMAWVLLGLLILSSGLLVLGSRERTTQPSATSYGPSGTRVLAELLRDAGYQVEVSRLAKPKLRQGDLALGFLVKERWSSFGGPSQRPEDSPTKKAIRNHVENGGRALILQVPNDFVAASKLANSATHQVTVPPSIQDKPLIVSKGDSDSYESTELLSSSADGYTVGFSEGDQPWLRLFGKGKGMLGVVYDATGATNRFIDREANADAFDRIVRFLAAPTGRIVFIEALHSAPVDPGLIAAIGSWASAAWWQLILMFLLICYTLGKRFGLPETVRGRQRGGRELVDAYADVLSRSNKPQIPMKKVVHEIDREVRKRFSISADLPPKRRNETLPQELAEALSRAELASESELSDASAVRLLWSLEEEMAKLKGEPIKRRKRKKK